MRLRSALLPIFAAFSLGACSAADASDAAFGEKVRAYLLEHPEVLEEALTKLQETRTVADTAAATKALASNHSALIADARDPVIGNPKAPITVVEFFDYRCGYCKSAAPEVLALAEEFKDVRLVMKEMPILSPESEKAARLALAANTAGKYAEVHRALMAERALDDAAIARIAAANGLTVPSEDSKTTAYLAEVSKLAETLKIAGTPAFIIGDQMIPGADIAALRAAVEKARKGGPAPT